MTVVGVDLEEPHFVLAVRLGNEAMSQPLDIAAALTRVAVAVASVEHEGAIRDRNGNLVGRWALEWPQEVTP